MIIGSGIMVKEYIKFIKDYLNLAELKIKYVVINILSAFFYKVFSLLLPLIASLIIRYLTNGNSSMTYYCLLAFLITYILYNVALYINYKIYVFDVSYCYDKLTSKVLNKLLTFDSNFTRFISKGRLMNSINSDIINIGDMNDRISELLMGILQIVGVLVIVGFYNIYLTLLLVVFAIIYITVRNVSDRKINYYHNKVVVQDDKYSTLLTQIVSGLQEIKSFNMQDDISVYLEKYKKQWKKENENKNIDQYKCSEDAIDKWIATVHAIGITRKNGKISVYAPYGLSDIFSKTIRPIKHLYNSKELYDKKVASWKKRFSGLNIIEW